MLNLPLTELVKLKPVPLISHEVEKRYFFTHTLVYILLHIFISCSAEMDSFSADNRRDHSEEELDKVDQSPTGLHAGLRRIPDKFPRVALLILVVEVC